MKNIFITGAAGFIGANLVKRLLQDNWSGHIIGIDNLNNYADNKQLINTVDKNGYANRG